MADIWPSALRVQDHGTKLMVTFESGETHILSAEYLRVESPSAEVKGHGPGQEQLVSEKRHVTIKKVDRVGSYAVKLTFSDGHDTGLFTWTYLATLGREHDTIWTSYEEKLEIAGRSRG